MPSLEVEIFTWTTNYCVSCS